MVLFKHKRYKIPAWQQILIKVYNTTNDISQTIIARKLEMTYSHLLKVLKVMEKNEIIERERVGRENIISLTPQGEVQAIHLMNVLRHIEDIGIYPKDEMQMLRNGLFERTTKK